MRPSLILGSLRLAPAAVQYEGLSTLRLRTIGAVQQAGTGGMSLSYEAPALTSLVEGPRMSGIRSIQPVLRYWSPPGSVKTVRCSAGSETAKPSSSSVVIQAMLARCWLGGIGTGQQTPTRDGTETRPDADRAVQTDIESTALI
jgi:hypothetical protein